MSRRTYLRSPFTPFVPVLLVLASGCATGQTGGEIAEDGTGCVVVEENLLAPGDETPLGSTGRDLLKTLEGEKRVPFRFLEPSSQLTFAPKSSTTMLTLSITPNEKSLRSLSREVKKTSGGGELAIGGLDCGPQVSVRAKVLLTTDDGALDEELEAEFAFSSPRFALATIELPRVLGGSLKLETSQSNTKLEKTTLVLALVDGSPSGSIGAQVVSQTADVTSARNDNVARFPLETCESGYPMTTDTAEVKEMLTLIDATGPFNFTWPDSTVTELHLTHQLTGACYLPPAQSSEDSLSLSLTTTATTLDLAMNSTLMLRARIDYDSASKPSSIHLEREAYLEERFPTASFATDSGISGFQVSGAPYASFDFTVDDLIGDAAGATGQMTFFAITPAQCPETVPSGDGTSSPGCMGDTIDEVGTASFSKK